MTMLSRKEQFIEGFNAVNRWLPYARLAVGILNKCVVPIITHYKTLSAWKENKAEALLSVGKIGVKVAGNLFKSFIIKSGVNYLSKATLAGRKLIWSIIE